MRRRLRSRDGDADWIVRARRSDFHLSGAAPVWADAGVYERSTSLELDIHAGLEVGIILGGRAERHFQDYLVPGIPGDVWRVITPRGERVVMVFLPEFLGEEMLGDLPWWSLFAVEPRERPRVTGREMRETALSIGRELHREISERPAGWHTPVRLGLLRLLFYLSRGWRPPIRPRGQPIPRAGSLSRIMPALTLLHERSREGLSLSEAACACNLGQSRFALLFRQTMGLSFGKFALRARLSFGAHLLRTTDLVVADVASRCGFVDASHFHRTFVKHYGCTPRRYRESGR